MVIGKKSRQTFGYLIFKIALVLSFKDQENKWHFGKRMPKETDINYYVRFHLKARCPGIGYGQLSISTQMECFLFFCHQMEKHSISGCLLYYIQPLWLESFQEQVELRRRAVYSTINERLKLVQEREELRCMIGKESFSSLLFDQFQQGQAWNSYLLMSAFLCQSIAIEQITLRFSSFDQEIAII